MAVSVPLLLLTLVAAAASVPLPAGRQPQRAQGLGTISLLRGEGLAEWNKLSAPAKAAATQQLERMTVTENDIESVHFDGKGKIFIADAKPIPKRGGDSHGDSDDNDDRRRAISDVTPDRFQSNGLPIYHSKPGSQNVIFVDFDGHKTTSSSSIWGAFDAKGYNPRGSESTFDSVEQKNIGLIWARMAEDYAPFDVDVTTEEPATFTRRTIHCLICANFQRDGSRMPYSGGAGGVAYVDIFNQRDTVYSGPALVYWENLNNGDNGFVAEAASHEVGHNMGLSHDGTNSLGYYGGDEDPSDPTSWGPIMGTGYDNSVSQWSKGEYNNADNFEDDVAIMANQFGLRPDEAGQTTSSAASVTLGNGGATFKATGVINSRTDRDYWKITVLGSGTLSVTAKPWKASSATAGGNLDILLRLRNQGGNIIKTHNPSGRTDAALSQSVTPGTYYVEIDGTSEPNGYSDYASLGQYDIEGTLPESSGSCSSNTDCPNDGLWCNGEFVCSNGECVAVNTDRCAGQTCNEAQDKCEDVATTTTTTQAPSGELSCSSDDAFESNNGVNAATRVQPGQSYDAIVCGANDDWYKLDLCGSTSIDVVVAFQHSKGDIDAAIWYNGDYIVVSQSTNNKEVLSVTNNGDSTETIYINVYGYDNAAYNTYTLSSTTSGSNCGGSVDTTTTKATTTTTTTKATTKATTTKATTTTTTAGGNDFGGLAPGQKREVRNCACTGNRQSNRSVRRSWSGLIEFCLEKIGGRGAVSGQIRVKLGRRWKPRSTTSRITNAGDTLCVYYRPRIGEEDFIHDIRQRRSRRTTAVTRYHA